MENCKECDAILQEYRIAYADFWEHASEQTRDACRALGELVRGTETDIRSVEGRLSTFQPMNAGQLNAAMVNTGIQYLGGSDPLKAAMLKKWQHQQATGHVVRLGIDPASL
jgi:hypothetical protein